MHHRICGSAAGALALAVYVLPLRAEDIPQMAAYCEDLLRITDVAATTKRFSAISGRAREGDFLDTTISLAGWKDCSVYGARTYTCDLRSSGTATDAQKALASLVKDVTACLGGDWAADKSRSSPDYVVVRDARGVLSITLSADAASLNEHTVRLTLFVRGRP